MIISSENFKKLLPSQNKTGYNNKKEWSRCIRRVWGIKDIITKIENIQ